ncbi:MAG: hypothetical protein U0P46_01095 [Holophagaceae bacterium]
MAATVEEAKGRETELNVVEGMQFDRGYLSPYFVTNPDQMKVELENAQGLRSSTRRRSRTCAISCSCWSRSLNSRRPLLIIAEDADEALATLVNKIRGTLNIAAVEGLLASATAARPCSRTSPS